MKINRLALIVASIHWAEGENAFSLWAPRYLTNLDIGMGRQTHRGKRQSLRDFSPNFEVVTLRRINQWAPFLRPVPLGSKRIVKAYIFCPPSYHFDIIAKSNLQRASSVLQGHLGGHSREEETGQGSCGTPLRIIMPRPAKYTSIHRTTIWNEICDCQSQMPCQNQTRWHQSCGFLPSCTSPLPPYFYAVHAD